MIRARYFVAIAICGLLAGTASAATLDNYVLEANGWQITLPQWAANVGGADAVIDKSTDSDVLILELFKLYKGTGPNGAMQDVQIVFEKIDANAASVIQIENETIINQTGLDWVDFHMDIVDFGAGLATFENDGLDHAPFDTMVVSDQSIDFYDGVVAAGDIWFLGDGNDPDAGGRILININPDSTTGDMFILKEVPSIPEPATMSLLGFGVLAMIRRRRR
ncbi:MAG: PEP-CTERM sorting domain-containing protein [Phycisphaerae bacterium]